MRIMRLLRQAFPKVQFIVTTHDPLCLRGMYDGEVFVLQRTEMDAMVETVPDLPSVRGMRAEQLLTSEFFGLGSTDPETDAKLLRFHRLVVKDSRDPEEEEELNRLGQDLNRNFVAGNTIGEQMMFEAMRRDRFEPFKPIAKVTNESKKAVLAEAMAALEVDGAEGQGS